MVPTKTATQQLSLLLLLLVLFIATASSQPPKLPNIGYIGYGYNIFYGNPHDTTTFDPGFGDDPVFDLTYSQGQTTPDGHWTIPDDVGIPGTASSCTIQGSSIVVQSSYSYMQSLSVDVSADFSGWGAAFSASTDYKTVQSGTSSVQNVYVETQANCQTYKVNVNSYLHPNLSSVFVTQGSLLPTTFDPNNASAFWTFFDYLGTHFSTQMIFGARWGYRFESTSDQWTKMQETDLDVDVAASYEGLIKAGVSVNTSTEQQEAQQFSELTTSTSQYSLGNPPPADGNTNTWENTTLYSNAMDPLQYTLSNISILFTSQYTSIPALNERYQAVAQALDQYCQLYLLPQGAVSTCQAPPPPPPPPPPIGYGALGCVLSSGNPDCFSGFAAVYNGQSAIQAQQVVLDMCPTCSILATLPDELSTDVCLAMMGDSNCESCIDTNNTISNAEQACYDVCNPTCQTTCGIMTEGCTVYVPPGTPWGAIACSSNCDTYGATPNDEGLTDRLEAHQVADQACGSGCNTMIDYNECGAVVRCDHYICAAEGATPQEAESAALSCNGDTGCNVVAVSCAVSSALPQKNIFSNVYSTQLRPYRKRSITKTSIRVRE